MTSNASTLIDPTPLPTPSLIHTADGTPLPIISSGYLLDPHHRFHVPDVLHVPRLSLNLFSVSQIADLNCLIMFDSTSCLV